MELALQRNEHGQFLSGHNGGPGRPRGSRNKLGEEFCAALYADFQEHGVAVIEAVRIERPWDYLKVVAALAPREIDLRSSDGFAGFSGMDKERAVAALDELIREVNQGSATRNSEDAAAR
jgi:hypothetical protein